jgi:hypothetical protein
MNFYAGGLIVRVVGTFYQPTRSYEMGYINITIYNDNQNRKYLKKLLKYQAGGLRCVDPVV